jgi:hypothetical protein
MCHEIDGSGSSADVERAAVVKQSWRRAAVTVALGRVKRDRAIFEGPKGKLLLRVKVSGRS